MKIPVLQTILLSSAAILGTASAEVPTSPPVFTNPLNITNRFMPFEVGGMKVYAGHDENRSATSLDLYLADTRNFTWNATTVACHTMREVSFLNGKLVEISANFFAQADDGTVYYFGEVVNIYNRAGDIVSHEGSWLVGGPTGGDPTETATATNPAVFMPARPQLGDKWKPEDLFPIVDETDTVLKVHEDARVPAGKFEHAIVVRETTRLDSSKEFKTYAPGVGPIIAETKDELLELTASTLQQSE